VTHVCVSCGDPSGMSVEMKQGLGLRSRSSNPSGSGWGTGLLGLATVLVIPIL
jgi:hypothetical protein